MEKETIKYELFRAYLPGQWDTYELRASIDDNKSIWTLGITCPKYQEENNIKDFLIKSLVDKLKTSKASFDLYLGFKNIEV